MTTPPPSPATFGERLRQLRKATGMQQQELAKRIEVNFTYISKIEKVDGPTPAPETIAKIATALQLSEGDTSELFQLAQKMPPSVERLIVAEPEAVNFYHAVNRSMSDDARREFFRKLIREIEGEAASGPETPPLPATEDER